MRLNDVKPQKGSKKRRKRVGRGISAGQGASAGLGMRGQKSRSGSGTRPGFEGGQQPLYRRIPKLKGFPLMNRRIYTTINVEKLND
jgi:large subunit ribosomal protein L15